MVYTLKQRIKSASRVKVVPQTIPVSITGLNTRDAVTAMPPTDAVILENWYPDAGGLTIRGGTLPYISGLGGGYVNTLAQYSALGITRFIAACGGNVYDITGGASSVLGGGFSSDKWQTANFNDYMFLVNGSDAPQKFDGTTLSAAGFTGPTVANIIGVNVHQNRLFFWLKNDNAFYYADINAITGAITRFPLSMVSQSGGDIVTMTTMSHDGGNGIQDLAVFILSSGETIIYAGTDPGDDTLWALVGRYKIAPPVNIRAVARYGAESYLTTFDDHVPLQQQLVALKLGQIPPRSKISGAVRDAVAANPNAFGFEAFFYPQGRRLIFNIPIASGQYEQHVYNVSTDAWCIFTGMPAITWGLYNNGLYFGGPVGTVYQADVGTNDNGVAIVADGQPAWNSFEDVRRKRISAVRPVLQAVSGVTYSFGVGFDYESVGLQNSSSTITSAGSPWNTSPWDTSYWSPENITSAKWKLIGGDGTAMGFRLRASTTEGMSWLRTDIRYEIGRDI